MHVNVANPHLTALIIVLVLPAPNFVEVWSDSSNFSPLVFRNNVIFTSPDRIIIGRVFTRFNLTSGGAFRMINSPGEKTMALQDEDLVKIGAYVQQRLPEWLAGMNYARTIYDRDMELRERIVRVEEELKNQRELLKQGFEQMDKRIDQVDKRIDQVDKRIDQLDKRLELFESRFSRITVIITAGFAMMTVLMSVYRFVGQ
ncbi:MAG TPA: hypothetical protein P5346_00800 [Spirochaetota bacterium]|nr:hypothetical protein [Spirochaetota bacterium]HSA13250.1 hypothetical protein [Spirochaetota bacterium]